MARFGRRGGTRQGTGSNVGAGTFLSVFSALVLPIWILAGAAWIVQLVGLAMCQHQQTSGGHFLMFDWFVTSATCAVLLMVPFHLIARRASPGIVTILGVVTVLEILRTNVWNDARLARGGIDGVSRTQIDSVINPGLDASTKRVLTLFSGYLITSFFNMLLILGLGSLPAPSAQDARQMEHGARNAHDQHKQDNYQTTPGANMNQPAVNNGVSHNGGVHNGVSHNGGMHNGVDRV